MEMPDARRIIAISDVHAHHGYLMGLLEKVRFGPDDLLVIVGDILERGQENLATLRAVMGLTRTHRVLPLIGNVDEWALDKPFSMDAQALAADVEHQVAWHGGSFVQELADALGMAVAPDMDVDAFRKGVREAFAAEYAFMEGLPTVLQMPALTFVHGGIPPGPVEALEGLPSRQFTKRNAYMEEGHCLDRWTIVGHWPLCLYAREPMSFAPFISEAQRIIGIDGGCGVKQEGQLNALIIEAGAFSWDHYDALPVRVALDAQAASDAPRHISYMDGAVNVLRRDGDVAHVEHKSTGLRMWVPATRLSVRAEETHCNDISDYRLPVAPGDTLSVLWETKLGAVCKKDGVEGWYLGRWAQDAAR